MDGTIRVRGRPRRAHPVSKGATSSPGMTCSDSRVSNQPVRIFPSGLWRREQAGLRPRRAARAGEIGGLGRDEVETRAIFATLPRLPKEPDNSWVSALTRFGDRTRYLSKRK